MNAFERVERWRKEWLAADAKPHWGDEITWTTAQEIARRLDEPMPLDSAPRDGTPFDIQQNGVPYLDCYFTSSGRLAQDHGYPSMQRIFDMNKDHKFVWFPRPADRIMPYHENSNGRKYIP